MKIKETFSLPVQLKPTVITRPPKEKTVIINNDLDLLRCRICKEVNWACIDTYTTKFDLSTGKQTGERYQCGMEFRCPKCGIKANRQQVTEIVKRLGK